jgi:putative transposase
VPGELKIPARACAFSFLLTFRMLYLILLFVQIVTTLVRLAGAGGVRSVVAESVLLRHQLLVPNRSRRRAPNLGALDRLITGWCALLVLPRRLIRCAIVAKPSTVLSFHRALVHRKYQLLFSPKRRLKPGPKGPDQDLINAVIEMKQRNPRWGCPRIAQQAALAFGVLINKDVVRRILAAHYQPSGNDAGPIPQVGGLHHCYEEVFSKGV